MAASAWYQYEDNLILLCQGGALFLSVISLIYVILAVLHKEKSFFYASAVLLTAYSIYFVNTKLALAVIFVVFIIVLNLRKKVGINT